MNRTMQLTLIFEVLVFLLALPGMVLVDHVAWTPALLAVGGASVGAILASGGLKKSWGYPLGWLVQIGAVAMGLMTSMMYAVGIVFLAIWVMSFVMGRRIEQRPTA